MLILINRYVDHNQLTNLPQNWNEVYTLEAGYNNISSLPSTVSSYYGYLRLESLSVEHNSLKALPASFTSLTSLEYLQLSYNNFKSLGPSFMSLSSLVSLDISHNEITKLPALPSSLSYIEASNNKISFLESANMSHLTRLYYLNLGTNLVDGINLTSNYRLFILNLTDNCLECTTASHFISSNTTYFICDNSTQNTTRCAALWNAKTLKSSVIGVTIAFNAFLVLSILISNCLMLVEKESKGGYTAVGYG